MEIIDLFIKVMKELGVPVGIILFGAWFLTARVWPYYTVTNTANAKDLQALMGTQTSTLIEMKSLLVNMDRRLEHVEDTTQSTDENLGELRRDADRGLADLTVLAAQASRERRTKRAAEAPVKTSDKPKPKPATKRSKQKVLAKATT